MTNNQMTSLNLLPGGDKVFDDTDEDIIKKLPRMSKRDLCLMLSELEASLEDMQERTSFMLRSTGHHIRGVERKKHESKLKGLEELIQAVERELRTR